MQKTIFFDLGNVLIFFDHQKMCRQVAGLCGLEFERVQDLLLQYGDAYERGTIDNKKVHEELCRLCAKLVPFDALMHALSDIFEPNLPVIDLAEKLKEKGHRLFLLSNTCEAHFTYASTQFAFLKNFDGFVLSYEVGARKPEKEIYEKALHIAGCEQGECFYIDDVLPYVASAKSMNIDAEQYTTPQVLKEHLNARGML